MRKIISLFFGVFFILQFSYAQEKITDPNEWDFGKVKQGIVLKHDFLLKNQAAHVLKIESINTSCGCTVSQADKKSLAPQETTLISASFNTKGYTGEVKQFIYVNTDDADLSVIRFVIKANVVKEG